MQTALARIADQQDKAALRTRLLEERLGAALNALAASGQRKAASADPETQVPQKVW